MTLSELADVITTTINQIEAEDVAACKSYLTLRHKMIWQDQMWKDSLVEYEQTITSTGYTASTSTWLPTRQVLLVAPIVAQVVAVRTQNYKMGVQSSEIYYRRDFDSFQNQGTATEYRLLSPAVWDFDTAQTLSAWATASADAASVLRLSLMESDGITEDAEQVGLQIAGQSVGSLLTLLSASKTTTDGDVGIGTSVANIFQFTVDYFGAQTLKIAFNSSNIGDAVASGSGTFVFTTPVDGVRAGTIAYFWLDGVPTPVPSYTISLAGTLTIDAGGNFAFAAQADLSQTAIVTLEAADTVAVKRQRIQLIGAVADNTILRILGKRTCPEFSNDSDEPAITGCENCLLALAFADMLVRERQYGKAQLKTQEATALMAQLIREQTSQQAHKKRFVPADGFGGADAYPFMTNGLNPLSF